MVKLNDCLPRYSRLKLNEKEWGCDAPRIDTMVCVLKNDWGILYMDNLNDIYAFNINSTGNRV